MTRKIGIRLPDGIFAWTQSKVEQGSAESLSGLITQALERDRKGEEPFTTASLRAVSEVTVRAVRRLRNIGPDEPLLPWGDVPHVLHRGPIALDLFQEPPPYP